MKSRIIDRANKKISFGGVAALLMATALIAQVLGFLKVKFINANFDYLGTESTDAFFAAFKVPDFFFYTVAAGALGVAFIPFLADHLEKHDKEGVWELASSLLNLMAVATAFVGVIIFIFAEPLISHIVAPGMNHHQLHDATIIMRLIAFNPFLFTLSGILTATQQVFGRFFFYAIGPIVYNLSIILSIFIFKNNIGLIGLGIGALVGALLQLMVVFFGMGGMNFKWKPTINFKSPDFRHILRLLPSRSVDQGIDSINSIVETNFASKIGTGAVTFYESAYTLHTAPIILIGNSIATAAFPRMSERLSQGHYDLFRKEFLKILRIMIWIAVPVVVVCFFARGYLARIIFSRGAPEIAAIFGFLCVAIFFRIVYAIVSRYFYAQKDTWTPLVVSIIAIALNIYLAWQLSRPANYGVSGLAMAQSIVAAVEVLILFSILIVKDVRLFDRQFWGGIWQIMSVTGFSVVATYVMLQIFPLLSTDTGFLTLGVKLGLITFVTGIVHLGLSSLFGLEEAVPVIAKMRQFTRFILRPVKIGW
ncbi:MAG: oligosaccharide flippase family protein [bacterium]|nr:oligosaccharide flippase family protein [bacterium]